LSQKLRVLQGSVIAIERTGEKKQDGDGNTWERCIFTIRLTGFSRRTPELQIPPELEGKVVKQVRWCAFDWHYYPPGTRKTLTPEETEAVLAGRKTETVFW
jgi:hypothetical protein